MNSVLVVQDRFQTAGATAASNPSGQGKAANPFIRRPARGIQIKEDTFATIRLVAGVNGQNISLVDAGSRRTDMNGNPITINGKTATDIYSNFLLQQVHEERMEKVQILETFGEPYIFLFGERPRMVTFQGILLNTADFNWEAEWWWNYDNYLRGTKAVENDARAFISYDQTLVSGYILSASADKIAGQPYFLQFQFQVFLTDYTNFSNIGNPYAEPGFPLSTTNNGTNQTNSQLITSQAAAKVFTPTEIQGTVGSQDIADFNNPPTLADGFANAVGAVTQAWNATQSVVNTALTGVAGNLQGGVVRIPYGFAGALVFNDSEAIPLLTQPQYGVSTTFGTYSQNDDEYVGVGTQYGSSVTPAGVFQGVTLPGFSPENDLTFDQQMVDEATSQWEDAGFVLTGSASSLLTSGSLGLQPVSLDSVAASSPNPGTANPPFGAGISSSGFPE